MKKFLTCLLAVGLVAALCVPALAVDVKFSGTYVFEGWQENNRNLRDDSTVPRAPSTSWMDQYMILNTQFKIAEGLSINTKARVMDTLWGLDGLANRLYSTSPQLNQNIEFEEVYAEVKFGPGYFVVGQGPNGFGLPFSAWDYPTAQFRYFYTPTKNWLHLFMYEKLASVGVTNNPVTGAPVTNPWFDSDYMRYNYNIYYFGDKWEAGGMFLFDQDKAARGATGTTNQWFIPEAFVKATFGPLYVEAQINYAWGQIGTPDSGVVADHLNINSYQWYGKAQYTMGPVYFGGQYSYTSGQKADDPGTVRAFLTTGRDYKPCLILINPDRDKYIGPLGAPGIGPGMGINNNYWGSANAPNTSGSGSTNFSLYQVFGGFKPVPKLDVYGSFTYANINEKPTGWVSDNLGYEVDITATYKLYDNVSYMVGFGYLFTGDAWKGTLSSASTSNDWLLMHKLTINF